MIATNWTKTERPRTHTLVSASPLPYSRGKGVELKEQNKRDPRHLLLHGSDTDMFILAASALKAVGINALRDKLGMDCLAVIKALSS